MARNKRQKKPITSSDSRRKVADGEGRGARCFETDRALINFSKAAWAYIDDGGEARYLLGTPLIATLGEVNVSDINQEVADRLANECWPKSSSATRSRQCYGPLSAVLKFSARRGWCDHWRLRRPKLVKKESTLPTDAELRKFVHASRPHLKRIVVFLLRTGAGVANTLRLDWSDIDLVKGIARLGKSKGGPDLVVLDEIVVQRLALTRPERRVGKVFPTHRGQPYRVRLSAGGQLKSALAYARNKSGIKITPSTLKRVWQARRRGERPDVEVHIDRSTQIVANLMSATLTKYREPESNGSKN